MHYSHLMDTKYPSTVHMVWHTWTCTHSPTRTGTTSLTLHSYSRHHGIHGSLILSSPMTPIGLSMPMTPLCSIQTLTHMEITITALLRVQHPCQMMRRPLQILKIIPHPHGHLLPRTPLIPLLNPVSCRLTCTALSTLAPKLPQTLIVLMMIYFLPTMDHVRWFQPHGIMTSYAPCLPGFLMTSLRKPLMSRLSMPPIFLTTLFSASILNYQIWP